jgi:transcriptional regulator with XRE-family HTH domain
MITPPELREAPGTRCLFDRHGLRERRHGATERFGWAVAPRVLISHIMPSREPFDQQQVGRRIADARVEAELTQADLAQALGLDRSAVAKMEAGTRGVSAVELARISARLDRPLEWFLVESPPAIVSRRTDLAADLSLVLDRTLERRRPT